jgi:hypothetical protein
VPADTPSVSGTPTEEVTYVTVSDAGFFPGTVALVNSLRLTGNDGVVLVVDCGLEERQAELLRAEAQVMRSEAARDPVFAKASVAEAAPSGTLVFVDSDVVVCAPLAPIVERARAGAVCLFPDHRTTRATWRREWEPFFGLKRSPRRQTYGNAGFVVFSTQAHPALLDRWREACALAAEEWPPWTSTPDQDALNALLMSEVAEDAVEILPEWEGPLLERLDEVRVLDERTLAAALGGRPTLVLHYVLRPKLWGPRGWLRLSRDAYTTLLLRALWWDDVPLRISPRDVPPWLRPGRAANTARMLLSAAHVGAAAAVERSPESLRRRLLAARDAS